MSQKNSYDFIILGGGGTGLASAMYSARLGLKTLVLGHSHGTERHIGGVITTTYDVENYPGFKRISGPELAEKIEEHALSYDLVTVKSERALSLKKEKSGFIVKTAKATYKGKTILFATGTKWRKLPDTCLNASRFDNKGVSYCALCDAPLYKNKIVGVVGGSDTAAKDALLLSKYAKKVYIIHRSEEIHPEPINLARILQNKKIEVIDNANLKELLGEEHLTGVILDRNYKGKKQLNLQGLFVAIGHVPLSDLAKPIGVKTNEKGEIKINHETSETNIPGVYAAGDITDKHFKQLIIGVADGCTAAYSAYEYITKKHVVG